MKFKKGSRPRYDNVMLCYRVDYKDENGYKKVQFFDTYGEGAIFMRKNGYKGFDKSIQEANEAKNI